MRRDEDSHAGSERAASDLADERLRLIHRYLREDRSEASSERTEAATDPHSDPLAGGEGAEASLLSDQLALLTGGIDRLLAELGRPAADAGRREGAFSPSASPEPDPPALTPRLGTVVARVAEAVGMGVTWRWFHRWVDPGWYRYLARRYPNGVAAGALGLLAVLAFAGYLAVGAMGDGGGSSNAAGGSYVALETTVMHTVLVRERGRVVVKHVLAVKRIYAKPTTLVQTQTVRTPAGTRVITRPVVRFQPVYRNHVVTVQGKRVTVSRVVTNSQMLTSTQRATVTNEQTNTVVQTQTVSETATVTRTQTAPAQTVTVSGPGNTVTTTATVTGPTLTVTVTVAVPPGHTTTSGP